MRLLSWDCWQTECQHQLEAFFCRISIYCAASRMDFFHCTLPGVYGGDLEGILAGCKRKR